MLKLAIIEDEKKTAETLAKQIKSISSEFEIIGFADTINSGIELILRNNPDIVFFDVEIKDGLSFEILKKLTEIRFQIIFTTAHSHYAIKAFEYSAIDYLVKPVNPDKLSLALYKAKKNIDSSVLQKQIEVLLKNFSCNPEEQKIVLQTADSNYYININEILRCESDNNYCNIILDNGEKIMVSKTLKEYETKLPSDIFFRAHQSHLINIKKIHQVKKKACKIVMCNGENIPLSVRRKELLLEKLK